MLGLCLNLTCVEIRLQQVGETINQALHVVAKLLSQFQIFLLYSYHYCARLFHML